MPIKVKKRIFLKEIPFEIKKRFARDLKDEIGADIIAHILQGKSPVAGHKFKQYSDSYARKKGQKNPVDMNVTGKMLDSLTVKQNKIGQLLIQFKSKIAGYHQEGGGKLPQRKLLPMKGDKFAKGIMSLIIKTLKRAAKKVTAKL